MRGNTRSSAAMACALALGPVQAVHATAYELFEQGAKSVGMAGANIADPGDASILATNPAGIAGWKTRSFVGSASAVRPSTRFVGEGRTFLSPPGGTPIAGGDGGDPGSVVPVPSFFYSTPVGPDWAFGAALYVPYGLSTSYDSGWVGRYHALKSKLTTVNLSVVGAKKLTDELSIGAGIGAIYGRATLSNALDLSSACIAQGALFAPLAALCAGAGYTIPGNAAKDGKAEFDGDAWAAVWTVSAQYSLGNTKLVAGYRSGVKLELDGRVTFTKPSDLPAPIAAAPQLSDGDANARVHLPESVFLSAVHSLNDRTRLYASANWARWSRVQELRLSFANGSPDAVTTFKWKNAWRTAIGVERDSGPWTLRAGAAYDGSPVRDEFREPRLPLAERTVLGVGVSYRFTQWSIDVGYLHMFFKTPTVNRTTPEAGTLRGEYPGSKIDMLTVQLGKRF